MSQDDDPTPHLQGLLGTKYELTPACRTIMVMDLHFNIDVMLVS